MSEPTGAICIAVASTRVLASWQEYAGDRSTPSSTAFPALPQPSSRASPAVGFRDLGRILEYMPPREPDRQAQ